MKKTQIVKIIILMFLLWDNMLNAQSLSWVNSFGGINNETSGVITLDNSGELYIAGTFMDTVDFDPGPSIYNVVSLDDNDAFILKLDSAGDFVWMKAISGYETQSIRQISFDNIGNLIVTINSESTADFDPGLGVYNLTAIGGSDLFVLKLNAQGNFVWVKQMGGYSDESINFSITDQFNNIYLTGSFQDTIDFDSGVGVYNLVSAGGRDIFVLKLDATGNLIWAKQLGG
ncbi:MAG: hypothetical protein IPJ79_11045 [Bacteroidetes bacterium]|nr:hypothetical protein [Bacteroidota bacterium]